MERKKTIDKTQVKVAQRDRVTSRTGCAELAKWEDGIFLNRQPKKLAG